MKEQTEIRLQIIAARFGRRGRPRDDSERTWLDAYEAVRAGVLRTAMTEIGEMLARDGHHCEVRLDAEPSARSIDFAVSPAGDGEAERLIRFFARNDERRGWQVVAEIRHWPAQSFAELTRFEQPSEITAEVAEHVLVDAIEQVFASVPVQRLGGE